MEMKATSTTMKRQPFRIPGLVLLILALRITVPGDILGPATRLDPFFGGLIPHLPADIDVVAGEASEHAFPESGPSRPRVAFLQGMPVNPNLGIQADWMESFHAGMTGLVGAVKPEGRKMDPARKGPSSEAFFQAWKDAPPAKRIFLSFTSADVEHAENVAKALEKAGYVTFVFLKRGDASPPYDPDFVGQKFAEAGLHLVLDSPAARRSIGVALEARQAKDIEKYRMEAGSLEMGDFRRQVDLAKEDWTLTENPGRPGRLYFHRTLRDGKLDDLAYLVAVGKDGSWSVHRAASSPDGYALGDRIGRLDRPPAVPIGLCPCCK